MSPLLPPDLERIIFELAAKADRKLQTALTIALVAHRAQIWMDWIIYSMVTLSNGPASKSTKAFLRTVESRSPEFFATHVKSLCLPFDIQANQAGLVLSMCTGLVNLAYWLGDPSPLLSIPTLLPRMLSTRLGSLFGECQKPDFTHPLFSHVTHLEVMGGGSKWAAWSGFDLMPQLTHIRFQVDQLSDSAVSSASLSLRTLLDSSKRLRVCSLYVTDQSVVGDAQDIFRDLNDSRIVVLGRYLQPITTWQASIRADKRFCQWLQAEDCVRGR